MNRIGGGGIMSNLTEVVKNLLIINVLVYIAVNVIQVGAAYVPSQFWNLVDFLGFHYFDSDKFKPFQIVSSMFVHGGVMHILFNMMSLFFLGPMLEQRLGSKNFFSFYFIAGIGAVLFTMLVNAIRVYLMTGGVFADPELVNSTASLYGIYNAPTVGASGAIAGIFAAFAMYFPNLELMIIPIPFPIKAKYLLMVMVAGSLFLGIANFSGDNIAHFTHLGGMLFGFLMILYWRKAGKV